MNICCMAPCCSLARSPSAKSQSFLVDGLSGDVVLETSQASFSSTRTKPCIRRLLCLTGCRAGALSGQLSSRLACSKYVIPAIRRHRGDYNFLLTTFNRLLSNRRDSSWQVNRLGNARFDVSAAAVCFTSSEKDLSESMPEAPQRVSDGEYVVNLGRKFWRFLALVLGLVAVLGIRPNRAWASEAFVSKALNSEGKGLLASAWAGLVAGCLHTLTGPDHLAGLAPLCIGRSRLQSAAVGALWGCGHTAGQMLIGMSFILLKDKLHLDLVRTWASRVVGLTLIMIGGVGILETQEPDIVFAEDAVGHKDVGGKQKVWLKTESKMATTFATGVVYGLQPDALLMILPALALPSRISGAAFLGMFLLGTVLAMGSYTLFLASCSQALQKRVPGITKNLSLCSSAIAIALGLALIGSDFLGISLF